MAEQPSTSDSNPTATLTLTSIYDVMRAIFRYLPIRSVDSLGSVCQSWFDIAQLTKQSRSTIHSFAYSSSSEEDEDEVHDLDHFHSLLSSFIDEKLWSIPSLAFVVVTESLNAKGLIPSNDSSARKSLKISTDQRTTRSMARVNFVQALNKHLNRSCRTLMIVSSGIINTDEQPRQFEQGDAMGLLLMPKCPPQIFGVYPFEIPRQTRITDLSRSEFHQLLGGIPDDLAIRFVVLFYRQHNRQICDCVKLLTELYSSSIVINGGVIDGIRSTAERDSSSFIGGFALTGEEKYLRIRQVVISSPEPTRNSAREQLKKLKSKETDGGRFSFGIQVSCVARDSEFYHGEEHVECSEFRSLFPQTPLIGVFGNGELGHDFYPEDEPSKDKGVHFRAYSSVFTLVSVHA